ncbi:serine/threonine-protein kinase [Aeoliella mucimassa]|uniref:Serine/threonine-protein kinase PrkC n=1 Tax=Aeoliella mucimassa TaxID=2527972 RepID=A0A518AP34_9BACT|nr:serine/threonine-protein kinase [Aeoliella mucimassa]QDU56485.1 Serine/threonine-protein kinase PrkC [Aeoliella mucimassa]
MPAPAKSVLLEAAAASGLVSPEQLHMAWVSACDDGDETRVSIREVSDEAIGRRLIELNLLNPWQVEQLKLGRTKFSLGPYRILDAIGRGGMGHVFKAEHEILGRIEALKVLPRKKTTADTISKFRHEIRIQAQLDHPNLVRVHYADREGDTYFFVTEFVPGSDLRKLIRRLGPVSYQAAALILQQAAEGLEHAHRRGLVHRDIKPGNILVTPDSVVKLIDLGLAWYLEADIHAAKQGDRLKIVGTADYLAPETIREPGRIVPVSDVYSMGCTLYYAVTGKVPFPGGNPAEKMQRHLNETPLPPQQLQPDLPKAFVELVAQMMSKDPKQRPPSAGAVAEKLRQFATEQAITEVRTAVHTVSTQPREQRHNHESPSPHLEDTLTYEDDPIGDLQQGSQGTAPIDPAADETTPDAPTQIPKIEERPVEVGINRMVIASVVLGGVTLVGVVGAILWEIFS